MEADIMLNDYLLHTLFTNAEENSLYRRWFIEIWGCPELFINFLKSASTQSQKTLAMDIVRQMTSISEFSVPYSAFANLVEVEHQGDDWGWINQEHAVHSINVYICGIYLFFFYKPLQQQLLWYFGKLSKGKSKYQSPLDEAIHETIQCLRVAALYHDLGYVLERTVDLTGRFNTQSGISRDELLIYQHIDCEVIYDITKKAVSHFIITQGVLYQDRVYLKEMLNRANWLIDNSVWEQLRTGARVSGAELKIELASMANMFQLKNILSWEGMKYFAPYLLDDNMLTIAVDSQLRPVIIHFISDNKPVVYHRHGLQIEEHVLLDIRELKPSELERHGLRLNYYVGHKKLSLPSDIRHLEDSIQWVAHHCRERFSCDFDVLFSENKIPELLHKINRWIERKVPLCDIDNTIPQLKAHRMAADNSLITQIYQKKATKLISEHKMEVLNPEKQMEHLGQLFAAEIRGTAFLTDLYQEYSIISNSDPDTSCDAQLQELMRITYQVIKESISFKKRSPVIELRNQHASSQPKVIFRGLDRGRFSHSRTMEQLYGRLTQNAQALGITWEDLEGYKSRYNYYDHGTVSAGILMEAFGVYTTVMEKLGDNSFFRCVWQIPDGIHALQNSFTLSEYMIEACFAILMHNIYVKSQDNPKGLVYLQDVNINSMSYFFAFCDTLQFWDRDKIFDPAKQRQPDTTYYGKDFELNIINDKIVVRCRTDGVKEKILGKLNNMDYFLKDASSILAVIEGL